MLVAGLLELLPRLEELLARPIKVLLDAKHGQREGAVILAQLLHLRPQRRGLADVVLHLILQEADI